MPASPITETLYTVSRANSAIESAAATSNAVTVTVTSSIVSTQTINVVNVTPPAGAGTYSFTVDNDTTSWFGGQTPPTTGSFVTSTTFITLEPVMTPVSTVSQGQSATSTSYLTLLSTIVTANPSPPVSATSTSYLTLLSTIVSTIPSPPVSELASAPTTSCSGQFTKTTTTNVTVTETIAHSSRYRPSASAGLYFGQARSGWNATMTTLLKSKGTINPSSGVAEKATSLQGISYSKETRTAESKGTINPSLGIAEKATSLQGTMTTLLKSKGTINPSLGVSEKATSLQGASYSKETRTADIVRLILARNGRSRLLEPRQVGGIVIDTIDGQIVSWTNEFDGQTPSTSEAVETPLSVPTTVQAIASSLAGKCCTSYSILYLY